MGIWDQLNTRTLFGTAKATAAQINAQEKDIHLQESNRAVLADVNLINTSLMRDGAPIPGTMTIKSTGALTEAGTVTVFQPAEGEVWQIVAMSMNPTGSGGHRGIGALYDGTATVELFDSSASSEAENIEYNTPLFIDNSCYLRFTVVSVDTSLELKAAMIRVR